jgi:VWFA-related protein
LTTPLKVDLTLDRSGKISNSLLLILVSLVLGVSSFPQHLDRPDDQRYDLKVPVELVLIPVTVQDKEGKLIYGLHKEDFMVYEEGTRQHITYFSADPSPLSVAVLIDRTVDDRTQDIFRQNMLALVEAFTSFDEMALYEFLDTTKRLRDFTVDKEQLLKAINEVEFTPVQIVVPSSLAYAPMIFPSWLDNAIMTAASDLQRRGANRRKVVFVICNGVTSIPDRKTYPQTKQYLLQNGIVVYGIGQGNSSLFRKVDPLKKYTEPTGGEVFYPFRHRAFSETYQKISETARNQYVLGYMPHNEVEEITYRSIIVKVTKKEFAGTVRSRKGYYALPRP